MAITFYKIGLKANSFDKEFFIPHLLPKRCKNSLLNEPIFRPSNKTYYKSKVCAKKKLILI